MKIQKIENTQQENQQRNYLRSGLIRTAERQETAPRLTELVELGLVEVVKKKFDKISGCNVAVYKRIIQNETRFQKQRKK